MERPDGGDVPLPGQEEAERGGGEAAAQRGGGGGVVLVGEGGQPRSDGLCKNVKSLIYINFVLNRGGIRVCVKSKRDITIK